MSCTASAWWTALNKKSYLNSLIKVQRRAELCISGALKITPSAALDILLNLPSLDIVGKKAAKNSALKLRAYDMWKSNNLGYSNITPVNQINTDFVTCSLRFGKKTSRLKFQLEMIGVSSTKTCKSGQRSIQTNRSSMTELVLTYINNTAIRLPDHSSVFQAEICTIHEAINWLETNRQSVLDVCFLSDSQEARQPYGHLTLLTLRRGQSSLAAYLLKR